MAHDDIKAVQNQQPGQSNPSNATEKPVGQNLEQKPGQQTQQAPKKDVQSGDKKEDTQKTGTEKH
jgi:hypothetical protein